MTVPEPLHDELFARPDSEDASPRSDVTDEDLVHDAMTSLGISKPEAQARVDEDADAVRADIQRRWTDC
jgi:hypothetical protein